MTKWVKIFTDFVILFIRSDTPMIESTGFWESLQRMHEAGIELTIPLCGCLGIYLNTKEFRHTFKVSRVQRIEYS